MSKRVYTIRKKNEAIRVKNQDTRDRKIQGSRNKKYKGKKSEKN
jgi:hypothetical protein